CPDAPVHHRILSCLYILRRPLRSTLFPYTTLFRSLFKDNVPLRRAVNFAVDRPALIRERGGPITGRATDQYLPASMPGFVDARIDRKSTRLNSSHRTISYAVFCLKKKTGRIVKIHY